MSQRNERRFQQPRVPTYDEAKPQPPKPTVYVDKKGREWLCEFLVLGEGVFGKTDKPSDATHRGFTWSALGEIHQRVYRFQPGDDRGTERETFHAQLAVSKRVPSNAEYLAKKRLERPINPTMAERIQEGYGGAVARLEDPHSTPWLFQANQSRIDAIRSLTK